MPKLAMPNDLKVSDLECVMLDLPLMDIRKAMGEAWNEEDLFYGDIDRLKYAQGAVAEEQAHVTLLFGIHPRPDYEYQVYSLLENWDLPKILIDEVGFFPAQKEGDDYYVIVAHVVPNMAIKFGHDILTQLPYSNEYDEYKPHVTLAYIKKTADKDEWIRRLGEVYNHTFIEPLALNLGLEDDEPEDD